METTVEKNADWSDVCRDIENNVRKYVPGPFRWTAKQRNLERDDVYGVCLGQGVCFFNLEEARVRKDDDTYIRDLATEILGFPPDSVQDLLRRLDVAEHNRKEAETELEEVLKRVSYWKSIEADMTQRLATEASTPGGA